LYKINAPAIVIAWLAAVCCFNTCIVFAVQQSAAAQGCDATTDPACTPAGIIKKAGNKSLQQITVQLKV